MRNYGADWTPIAASTWRMSLKDAAIRHVLANPYEIFEILMGKIREEPNSRLRLRFGTTGYPGSYATLNIMAESIGGIVGNISSNEADAALIGRGLIAIPNP